MSSDTDKPQPAVQSFKDFGSFLSHHRDGDAIKKAVKEQGVAQVQPEDLEPTQPRTRRSTRP